MSTLLQTPHGHVAYETFGSEGRPIVVVPGIGDTRASYRALAPALAARGYAVHAMDLRGHGGSDATFPSYTSEDIGDDVVALLEALDLQDAVLVGNSVGAAAVVHASLRSERAGRLVLLSGFVSDPPNFALLRVVLGVVFAWPWGVWAWAAYRKTLFANPPDDAEANQADVVANLREPGRLRAVRQMMCASKAGVEERLSQVRVPALIAMGAADPDFPDPEVEAERQAKLLGGSNQVAMVADAGHYPQIEQPEFVTRRIIAFIEEPADGS